MQEGGSELDEGFTQEQFEEIWYEKGFENATPEEIKATVRTTQQSLIGLRKDLAADSTLDAREKAEILKGAKLRTHIAQSVAMQTLTERRA